MRTPWVLVLCVGVAACAAPVSPSGDTDTDTEAVDTVAIVPTDSEPEGDTDPPPPTSTCGPDHLQGTCPTGLTCRQGACVVWDDPGDPVPATLADQWAATTAWADTMDLYPERTRTWTEVDAEGDAALADATTALEAAWGLTRAVIGLRNGHTALRLPELCDPPSAIDLDVTASRIGACVAEADGRFLVYRTHRSSRLRVGDTLLQVDGRTVEALVEDRLAQPGCMRRPAREAQRRAIAVASMFDRGVPATAAVVRGLDGTIREVRLRDAQVLPCDGRLAPEGEQLVSAGVRSATLEGGVTLVRIPEFGAMQDGMYSAQPVVDAFDSILDAMAPGSPLILDVRGTQAGDARATDAILARLLPADTPLRSCADRVGPNPEDVSVARVVSTPGDNIAAQIGAVAVLQDPISYGAAEVIPLALHTTGRGLLVGAPGSGTYGATWSSPPELLPMAMDSKRCVDAQGDALDNAPPPVDVRATFVATDLAAGIDSVIEAARVAVLAAQP